MSNYFFVSTGGAGNRILDSILTINNSYNGCFINSNGNEIKILDNYNINNSIIMNTDGNGANRSRDKAKKSYDTDKGKIINFFIDKITDYDCCILISSLAGGFGSGTTFKIAEDLKSINPNIKVSLIGVCPKSNSSRTEIFNVLQFYNELLECNYIDNYIFVDNNKMKSEEKFNKLIAEYILDSIEFNYAIIDSNDILTAHTTRGYKSILKLNPTIDNIEDAIEYAKLETPFILPRDVFLGSIGLVSVDKDIYDKNIIEDMFNVREFSKSDYNNLDLNIIITSGCLRPTGTFKNFESKYNELKNRIDIEQDLFKSTVVNIKNNDIVENVPKILNKREMMRRLKKKL